MPALKLYCSALTMVGNAHPTHYPRPDAPDEYRRDGLADKSDARIILSLANFLTVRGRCGLGHHENQ